MALEQPLDGFSYIIPKSNLLAWYEADSQRSNGDFFDLSLNARHLVMPGSSAPVVQSNVANKRKGVYWDGTKNPIAHSGSLSLVKHIWIIASYDDATFGAEYRGLLSDIATNGFLVGDQSTAKFFDFSFSSYGYQYRKRDIAYADNNQLAPVSGQISILEISFDSGVGMDGIQIGQDRNITARKWKGHFLASLFYSELQNENLRKQIYRYFAMKYHLWTQTSDNLNVFPFAASWRDTFEADKDAIVYKPLNASPVVRVRRGLEREAEVTFPHRYQAEIDATDAFYNATFPDYAFTYRDYSIVPYRDYEARFISKVNRTPEGVNLGTYSFKISAKDKP